MKTIFTIVFFGLINMAIAQDEFFQPGSTIGGYGELHWNKASNADGESIKNTMDFTASLSTTVIIGRRNGLLNLKLN